MTFWKWSQTAATNASADSTINWAEGQAPSSVNDSARAVMAAAAKYRDDISGAIVTAGTSTGYTVSSYQIFDTLAHMNGAMIAFSPHTTNGATVTLNVDGLGAKSLRSAPNVELLAGTIIQGTPYVATYSNSDGAWYLQNFFGNPYNVPLGAMLDYTLLTTPNSSFVFPIGQAISRTTYAALFAAMGTTYGAGDGSTTFNVPDLTGRVVAMQEASSTRLTTAAVGIDGATLGATTLGGNTLVIANLPPYTPAGTITDGAITISNGVWGGISHTTVTVGGPTDIPIFGATIIATQAGSTFAGAAQGGSSTLFRSVQPTIVLKKILRVI